MLSSVLLTALFFAPAGGQDATIGQRVILNVYLDNTGKALVTGFAEDIRGLDFLNTSVYRFENDTNQIFALTDGLTTKNGEFWTLGFRSTGYFDDFRVTFYLPSDMRLGNINVSNGLRYLLSASNESIVADVQGYEVFDPTMAIRYQQPLPANSGLPAASSPSNSGDNLNLNMLLLVALAILGVGSVLAIKMAKLGNSSEKGITKENTQIPETTEKLQESSSIKMPEVPPPCANSDSHSEIMVHIPRSDPADDGVYAVEASEESENNKPSPILEDNSNDDELPLINSSPESAHSVVVENSDKMKDIVITSEMEAVMETLTARERAVLKTLIDHGGRMTQAEIRYETGTPKSSLTGILISLERRKLITKKEWGRTNIIELSSWFLSKKEPS